MTTTHEKIPDTDVEIIRDPVRGKVRHVVFDFDGTLSYLRDGWQDFMVPLMVEVLEECPRHEERDELERLVMDFVDHLTGKQTIYQMMRLAEEVEKRGGSPKEPLEYKAEYNRRLARSVDQRIRDLESGKAEAANFLVPGALEFLRAIRDRDIRCYLASGTDIEFVRQEAEVLQVTEFFDGGIYGALPQHENFSKEKVIRKILADFDLRGPELLVVGDGYVEIQNGRDVGAVTWGIYTRENNRFHMNDDKRERLLRAGAELLSPDLTANRAVLEFLRV